MRNTLFALFLILFTSCSENANNDFEISMERMIENFNGDVSVYIEHMESGYSYTYRSEELFPTASMIKIPILIGVYDYIEKGKLTYLEDLIYKDSLAVEGVDLLASFENNSKIPLSELLFLMISLSDNTARLWAQDLAGGGVEINNLMLRYGFYSTKINSRVKGREQDYKNYGWGQTTTMEMSNIVKSIYQGKFISRAASEDMLRLLNNQYWNTEALSQIPPYVQTASKSGAVNPDAKVWLDTLNYGIRTIKRKPELNMLFKRYYGNNSLVRGQVKVYGDSEYTDQLSDYDDLLKNYSKELDWDWRYLAALIYTESRFDPKKVSWAGAQGLMQLMPKTFASYGVKNPFNPEQNIKAGVAHLGWLQNYWSTKLPEDVESMPFILASYNVGHGHVMDAIRLAQIENSDNFNWEDISQSLRNLSQPKYYTMQEVKYGFCRGSEPADYVKKIDKTYRSYSALVAE